MPAHATASTSATLLADVGVVDSNAVAGRLAFTRGAEVDSSGGMEVARKADTVKRDEAASDIVAGGSEPLL
ncbi:hypothetical protein IAQ61_006885 [Plenodomus lingam]|uniref:uncharacterized protein n=1 Tax=Leptosphaeria maculans TaxID=5022 RepID=UPI00331C20DC|nr:hypothetical protein IAQ61_006885 [Plenodomus lingam]